MNKLRFCCVCSFALITACMLTALIWGGIIKDDQTVEGEVSGDSNQTSSFTYHQEVGVIESILTETEHMVYSMHYPKFSQESIDTDINQLVQKTMEKATNTNLEFSTLDQRGMIYMNYDSYLVGQNIVSIIFYVEYNSSELANPQTHMMSKYYNLSTGKELAEHELFQGEYLKAIAEYCKTYFMDRIEIKDELDLELFQQVIAPEPENYQNLSLTKEGVLVTFTKDQVFSAKKEYQICIPYEELKEYLTFDYTATTIVIEEPIDVIPEEVETPYIDPDKPMIALTFDDGPNPKVTNRILDILKEYDSRATFFIVGNRLKNYPDTLQRIVNEKSELGSHTYHHRSLTLLTPNEIKKELSAVDDYLKELLGFDTATLRPPYGEVNDVVKKSVKKPMIYWSVDTEDWRNKDTDVIVEHVLDQVQDGDIILFHDLYETTAAAIEILVPKLIEEGYQLVTVSELFDAKEIPLENGEIYYHAR